MGGGLLKELDHLLVCEVVREVELEGVVDGGRVWGVDGNGEEVPPSLHQLLRDKGVPPAVLPTPLVQRGYCGSADGRRDGAQPRAGGGAQHEQGGEHLRARHSEVRDGYALVVTSVHGALGRHLSVVCQQEIPLDPTPRTPGPNRRGGAPWGGPGSKAGPLRRRKARPAPSARGAASTSEIPKTCLTIERRRNSMMLHVRIPSCRRRRT